jgi:hypothetical protein
MVNDVNIDHIRCKNAIKKIEKHSCPILDYVVSQQKNAPFGDVLDAGTGSHSLEWLLSNKITHSY